MKSWNKPSLFSIISMAIALLIICFVGSAILAIIAGGIPAFKEAAASREIHFALRLSVLTSTVSTIIVMTLAMPAAYALTRTPMPFKRIYSLIIDLTLSLPYILLGLSLLILFSSPWGKWLKAHHIQVVFSPLGIVMVHLLINLPYALRLIRSAFESADIHLEYIAMTLGATPLTAFLTILLPMCRNSLINAFILTWSRALGEFGATLMLVGVTRFKTETLPGSIYLNISTGQNDIAMATAMIMLVISGITLFLSRILTDPSRDKNRKVGI